VRGCGTPRIIADVSMKIVYFIDHLRADGAQAVLKRLVTEMSRHNHEQAIVCLNDSWSEPLVDHFRDIGVELRIVGKPALATGLGVLRTWRWLRHRRFDVAVTMLFASDVIGRFLAKAAGIRRIVTSLQARNTDYPRWKRWLVRRTMLWADVVVICNSTMGEFAIREEGALPDRVRYIPNSVVAMEEYGNPMSRAALQDEFGIPRGAVVMGSLGRLVEQKGVDVLLRGLALLARPDVHLILMGIGQEEERLRRMVEELGLARQVHFVGYRRDAPMILGALDLYVHPSRFEGMPVALLEAMAAGCPIVATSVDGNLDLIDDGVHGWLVQPEDSDALAHAMEMALRSRDVRLLKGAAARQRAMRQFSIQQMMEQWENALSGSC